MTRILIYGIAGEMGRNVYECCLNIKGAEAVAGVDRKEAVENLSDKRKDIPLYGDLYSVKEEFDAIIDFSAVQAIPGLLDFVEEKKIPLVLCTTGLSDEMIKRIEKISETSPVLRSANMSLGVNVLLDLVREAAKKLYSRGFDIEIVEQHHHRKKDAPSGTALSLADSINSSIGGLKYSYDRSKRSEARPHDEIGISSVRGGTICGVHDIIFAGEDEVVTLSHTAYSRKIFANGAISAAMFISGRDKGLYTMKEVL